MSRSTFRYRLEVGIGGAPAEIPVQRIAGSVLLLVRDRRRQLAATSPQGLAQKGLPGERYPVPESGRSRPATPPTTITSTSCSTRIRRISIGSKLIGTPHSLQAVHESAERLEPLAGRKLQHRRDQHQVPFVEACCRHAGPPVSAPGRLLCWLELRHETRVARGSISGPGVPGARLLSTRILRSPIDAERRSLGSRSAARSWTFSTCRSI